MAVLLKPHLVTFYCSNKGMLMLFMRKLASDDVSVRGARLPCLFSDSPAAKQQLTWNKASACGLKLLVYAV